MKTTHLARTAVAVALSFMTAVPASAQGTPRPAPPAGSAPPTAAPVAVQPAPKLDGRRLKPGAWSYRTTVSGGGQTRVIDRRLTLTPATLNGTAAWLVVDSQGVAPNAIADSLYLTRNDVQPLRQRLHAGPATVSLDFGKDSVKGTMALPQGSGPVAAPFARGAIVTGTMLEMYLRLLPIAAGWKGSLTMGAPGPRGSALVPLSLAVTGEERVTVPAGTFATYVVNMRAPNSEQTAWLNRDTREVVKISATFTQMPGSRIETVLMSRR